MNQTLPPPKAFGLDPHKFPGWRRGQETAIYEQLDCPSRFLVQILPTGAGKSLSYVTTALLSSGRTLFLTSSKGLQDQLRRDFSDHMVTIMGKNNYKCRLDPSGQLSCEFGPCRAGVFCGFRDRGCPYWDQVRKASKSRLVSANYAYWLMNRPRENVKYSIGDFDTLVCDEAHDSVNNLFDTLSTTIPYKGFPIPWIEENASFSDHIEWLNELSEYCKEEAKMVGRMTVQRAKQIAKLISLKNKADMLIESLRESNWVIDWSPSQVKYDPIWPSSLSEHWLFRRIKKVIMTSATIRPRTMNILGLEGDGSNNGRESDFVCTEYPNYFPISHRPIYYIPTVRVDSRSTMDDINYWIMRIDQIIRPRLDRNGIVHAVSFDRCEKILSMSGHSQHFFTHERGRARQAVYQFKEAEPPTILLSPSIVTGYDFPYDQARYQIICKIPFPDQRSKVDQERKKIDKNYGSYCAMQALQQSCGRIVRSGDDFGETLIIDDHAKWFLFKDPTKNFATQWFLDAVKWSDALPIAPRLAELGRRRVR